MLALLPEKAVIPTSLLIYFVLTSFSSLFSLLVCIYSLTKLMQLYKGFSIVDQLPSLGLQVRKWFLLGISVLNGSRCLCSTTEFILVSYVTIVNIDNPIDEGTIIRNNSNTIDSYATLLNVESIVSYYSSSHLSLTGCIMLSCRVVPAIFYLACCALLIFFVYDVCFKISGYNFEAVKIGWIFFNTIALMILLDNLLLYPSPRAIYLLLISVMAVYTVAFAWGTYSVYSSYAGSTSTTVTSNSNLVNSPKRIIFRLACLVLLILSSLLTYAATMSLDYFDVFHG